MVCKLALLAPSTSGTGMSAIGQRRPPSPQLCIAIRARAISFRPGPVRKVPVPACSTQHKPGGRSMHSLHGASIPARRIWSAWILIGREKPSRADNPARRGGRIGEQCGDICYRRAMAQHSIKADSASSPCVAPMPGVWPSRLASALYNALTALAPLQGPDC